MIEKLPSMGIAVTTSETTDARKTAIPCEVVDGAPA